MTLEQWIAQSRLARVDAYGLLCRVLNVSKAWCIAHATDAVPTAQLETLHALAQRRRAGEPLAYLIGEKEFYGRTFAVNEHVLVPRPETELIVETALTLMPSDTAVRVLDLGTGCGCIGLSLAAERPNWRITCVDLSGKALMLARSNAQRMGVAQRVMFLQSDWFSNVPPSHQYDLIVSNPPYVAYDDPHLHGDGLRFEPRLALTDFGDGLAAYRVFAQQAAHRLVPEGWLVMEHGATQAAAIAALFAANGSWKPPHCKRDLAGLERVTRVQRL